MSGLSRTETWSHPSACAPSVPPAASQSRAKPGSKWGEAPSKGWLGQHPGVHLALSPLGQCLTHRREPGGDGSPNPVFQDRDFLENEQFFLETLKNASYNVTSHSA